MHEVTSTLRLTSWNIGGVKHNLDFLRKCLTNCDIICLQEHWLYPDDLSFLDSVNHDFIKWGKCSAELNPDSISRRGKGGLAFLWRKNLHLCCEVLEDLSCDRMAVLNIRSPNGEQIYLIGVYLPTTSEPASRYRRCLDLLEDTIYQLCERGTVIVVGDFNAHIGKSGGPRSFLQTNSRGREIGKLMEYFEFLSVNSQWFCKGSIETFYSNGGTTKTTVDHIFFPKDKIQHVIGCSVLDECSSNLSYHQPISCAIQVNITKKWPEFNGQKLLWKKMEDEVFLKKYQDEVTVRLHDSLPVNLDINSPGKVEEAIVNVVNQLKTAALSTIPIGKAKPYLKSYWNVSLTSLKKKVKQLRKIWIQNGQPRGREHQCFSNYKNAKQEFRKAQRRAIYEEDTTCQKHLEEQYDVDRSRFFKNISCMRKKNTAAKNILEIDGNCVDDEDELLSIWKNHYEELYTPKDQPEFDNQFKQFVENKLVEYSQESHHHNDPLDKPFEVNEVKAICENLPNGKAGGPDNLTYEHLKYGGNILYHCLTRIYNTIRELECVAQNWTVGSIISLLKNGKKNKRDKSSYRGITLLNVTGKVLERLILNRLIPLFESCGVPSALQFAYQEGKSCVLSSFTLQEMVHHNVEKGSKVHCCFLDSSKAFDTVWLDGLFFKLFNIGLKGKSWRILRKWYSQMCCCVSLNGQTSSMFAVKQGVRQGGVLSPWLFLCFNNDIPDVLKSTGYGVTMEDIYCSSILVADDIALLSLRNEGLQCMINTMTNYSNKWRFRFNPDKTVVVTFGETSQMNTLRRSTRKWFINGIAIDEKTSWDHVGITLSGNFSSYERSKAAMKKGKAVMGELMCAGFRPGGINPICGASVWKAFGIPTMLYGCEVWSRLTMTEVKLLNQGNTFAAKRLQGLCQTTHSAGALGTIGMWSISGHIDKSKLLFFGNLCRMSPLRLEKRLFIKRLFWFLADNDISHLGFARDIVRILRLYDLYQYLDDYLESCVFPSKNVWRNIVMDSITKHQTISWKDEMLQKPLLVHLRNTHHELKPVIHWETAKRNPINRGIIANLVNLYCGNVPLLILEAVVKDESSYVCKICKKRITDIGYHFIMDCTGTNQERDEMWNNLINELPIQDVCFLHNLNENYLYEILISGKLITIYHNNYFIDRFVILIAEAVVNIFRKVSDLNEELKQNAPLSVL